MPNKHILQVEQAEKTWRQRHPEKARYLAHRTSARTFVRHYATKQDMRDLEKIWKKRNAKK